MLGRLLLSQTKSPVSLLAGGLAFLMLISQAAWGDSMPAAENQAETTIIKPIPAPRHPREMTYLKRKWGVEILFVRQTSAGYMLEFRYRVVDPEKAAALFVRKTKPVLIHASTGIRMAVPTPAKIGALRNSDIPIKNRTYWMFFANPNKVVKPGDLVNLQIGEFAVEGIRVQ